MTNQTHVRELHASIHYAKVNGLVSDHDAARHCDMILGRAAHRAAVSPLRLENAFRAAYGMSPIEFARAPIGGEINHKAA